MSDETSHPSTSASEKGERDRSPARGEPHAASHGGHDPHGHDHHGHDHGPAEGPHGAHPLSGSLPAWPWETHGGPSSARTGADGSDTTAGAPVQVSPPARAPALSPGDAPSPEDASDDPEAKTRDRIIKVLETIYDPEIPVNIWELGLIYDIRIDDSGFVEIEMTLTAPGCPVAGPLVAEVEAKVLTVPGVAASRAELVWDPPWSQDRMSEAAKLHLGFF
jgi:FeS assembly SUF system protein